MLLNVNYKIMAHVLAERLKVFLLEFIYEDQTGFLPGTQLWDNVRTILNTIKYYEKNPNKEAILFF